MIMFKLVLRRIVVVVGVVLSLTVGALAVRAASDWTAASAPLAVEPISARTLTQRLVDEQARSAALESQLDALLQQSRDLTAALQAADDRAAADTKTAQDLQAKLVEAKAKLTALQKAAARQAAQLKAQQAAARAAARTAARSATTHSTTGASGAATGGETEGSDD